MAEILWLAGNSCLRAINMTALTSRPLRSLSLAAILAFAMAVFAMPSSPPALAQESGQDEIDKKKNELEELRKELADRRARAKELEGKENNVRSQINEIDGNLKLTEKYINKLEQREKVVLDDLAELEVRLTDASGTLDQRKVLLAKRLRAMNPR